MIHDSTGGTDDDMYAAVEQRELRSHGSAAVDCGGLEAWELCGVAFEGGGCLDGEFASGDENEDLWPAVGEVDVAEEWEGEGGSFSGAGLGLSEDITAGEQEGDSAGLDGGWVGVSGGLDGVEEWFGEAELIEGGAGLSSCVCVGFCGGEVWVCMECCGGLCFAGFFGFWVRCGVDVHGGICGRDIRGRDIRCRDIRGRDIRCRDIRGSDIRG
jgi:hypothetical protein